MTFQPPSELTSNPRVDEGTPTPATVDIDP